MPSTDDDSRAARHGHRRPAAKQPLDEGSRVSRLERRQRTVAERRRMRMLYGLAVIVAFVAVLGGWWATERLFGNKAVEMAPARLTLLVLKDAAANRATAMALVVRDDKGPHYSLYVIPPELLLLGSNSEYVFAGDSLATGFLEEDVERVIGAQVDATYTVPVSALGELAGAKALTATLDRPVTITMNGEERAYDGRMVVVMSDLPQVFTPTAEGSWDSTTAQEAVWKAILYEAARRPADERATAVGALAAASTGALDVWYLENAFTGLVQGDAMVARLPSASRVAEGQFAFVPDEDGIMAAVTRKGTGYTSPYMVIVRNGSGKLGIATAVVERLEVLNVSLPEPANADRFNYDRTRLLVGEGAVTVAEDIRAILGRGVVLSGADVPPNTVVVIVGNDLTLEDLKPKDLQ